MNEVAQRRVGWVDVLVVAACAAAGVIVFILHRGLRHDDAYITFQYARNIVEGEGFVFNPGERVFGTTTPLFTLLMALVYAVFGDVLAGAAIAISALAMAMQGALVWAMVRDRMPAAGAGLALAVTFGFGGGTLLLALETCLFATLVIATVLALSRRRDLLAGACLGLAFLTRYDAGLLVLVVIGWSVIERRTLPRKTLVISLAIVMPWLVFAQLYFGSVFPHTLGAKASLTTPAPYLQHYVRVALSALPGGTAWYGPALAMACGILGVRWAWRECRVLIPLVVYAAAHALAYAWIGPPMLQHWHMYVPILVARLVIVIGVFGTLHELATRTPGVVATGLRSAVLLASVLICVATMQMSRRVAHNKDNAFWFGGRHARYEQVASWLRLHVRPDRVFMSSEVGTLGYMTRHRMIDPYGLITKTNEWPRTKSVEDKLSLIARYRPDVILLDSKAEANATGALGYRMIHMFPWGRPWSTIVVRAREVLSPAGSPLWERPSGE